MARGAFEIHAHENLRNVLSRLQSWSLTGIDDAAPDDAFGKARAPRYRGDKLSDEFIVRHIGQERLIKPRCDRFSPTVDITSAAIVVAKQVIPKRQPVLSIVLLISQ